MDPNSMEFKRAQLRSYSLPIKVTRFVLKLWVALYLYNMLRIYLYSGLAGRDLTMVMSSQLPGAIVYSGLILLSYYKTFAAYIMLTIVTIGLGIYSYPGIHGFPAILGNLFVLIILLVVVYGLLYAKDYEQLRDEVSRLDAANSETAEPE